MSKFEKIYDFFSGEMSEIEEKILFEELSKNDELRTEFNNHKKINDVIRRNNTLESAPNSSKEKLFANLGIDLPHSSTSISTMTKGNNKLLSGISYFSVAIISAVIVYFLINKGYEENYFTLNNKIQNLNTEYKNSNEKLNKLIAEKDHLISELKQSNNDFENKLNEGQENIKYIEKIVYIEKANSNNDLITEFNKAQEDPNFNNLKTLDYSKNNNKYYFKLNNSNNFSNKYDLEKIKFEEIEAKSKLYNFTIEFSNNFDFFNIAPRTSPDNFNSFNNNSISFLYNIKNNFDIGINVIGENYSLKYINTEEDGEYWYYQTPNFLTTSLVGKYRYELTDKFKLSPFISAGFNQTGGVIRGGIGLQYMISDIVGILLNSQYSNMVFQNSNTVYNSGKTSIQIGLIWKN